MGAFIEDHPVEHTVDNIAQGSGQYQRNANNKPRFCIAFDTSVQEPADDGHSQNAESGQKDLTHNLHTESHTVVLHKKDVKPVCHPDAFMPKHVCLDPYLYALVYDQNQKDYQQGNPPFRKKLIHDDVGEC